MKQKQICLFIYLLFVIICYQQIVFYNQKVINAILFSLIPSLLPALILVNLILHFGSLDLIYNLLKKTKFGRFIYTLILILIGTILGMPSIQILALNQHQKGILSLKSANALIYSYGCVSFPFLYGICTSHIPFNHSILILSIYFILNGMLLIFQNFKINKITITKQNDIFSFKEIIISSLKTIGIIGSVVLIFSTFLFILELLPNPHNYIIEGLIEFSYPLVQASKNASKEAYTSIVFLSLFPSLSIIFQSKLINKNLNIRSFLIYRLIIALLGAIIFFSFC